MENEFEVIHHPQIKYVNIFMVNIDYRNSHLHREIELVLLLEGRVDVTLKRENYSVDSPALILLGPNQPHEFKVLDKTRPLMLALQVSPKFFECVYPAIGNIVFNYTNLTEVLSKEQFGTICSLSVELGYQYFKKDCLYEFTCAFILHSLFGTLIGWLPHRIISDDEKKTQGQKVGRISRILSYADDNFTNKIRLSEIARQENLSISYMSHFFKENMNRSFYDYINDLRFNRARKLLAEKPDMSLLDICLQSGYSDSRYLRKAFVKRLGCTPDEYRVQHAVDSRETVSKSSGSSENKWSNEDSLTYLTDYRSRCGSRANCPACAVMGETAQESSIDQVIN